jgi:two-component system sensor histidine kinase RegB
MSERRTSGGRQATKARFSFAGDAHRVNFSWLITLRWGAMTGQIAIVAIVYLILRVPLLLVPLFLTIGVEASSNIAAKMWVGRTKRVEEWVIAALMAFDILILTALLYFSGGPLNPFSFLYLVQIALGAVVLRPRKTWALVALSLLCFGALFFAHSDLKLDARDPTMHHEHDQLHLQGMWVAFGVAAAFIVYFVQRVTRALAEREGELARQRTQSEKLASLATLAAGAAHELSTPLSTIAVVAKELEHSLPDSAPKDCVEDARLIRAEVERCRNILVQMADDAGESSGEAIVPITAEGLIESTLVEIDDRSRVQVILDDSAKARSIPGPPRALGRALGALVKNALSASPEESPIELRFGAELDGWRIEVRDHGRGMAPDVLARAGEPFFTTKAPGQGMGLGLFLTRTIVERLGGRFELSSTPGEGTSARLALPFLRGGPP